LGEFWSSLLFSHRIQFLEFIPGIGDLETPIDGRLGSVPFSFPGSDFVCYDFFATQPGALFRLMNASQKEQLFSNLAEAMQGVPARIVARQLIHFYKAYPDYGRGVAQKLGMDMKRFAPWAKLSLSELFEKISEESYMA
jgi:hypothetical protein